MNFMNSPLSSFGRVDWQLTVVALERFKILSLSDDGSELVASVQIVKDQPTSIPPELASELKKLALPLGGTAQGKLVQMNELALLGFSVANRLDLAVTDKQGILENFDPLDRTAKIIKLAKDTLDTVKFNDEIQSLLPSEQQKQQPRRGNELEALHSKLEGLSLPQDSKEYIMNEFSRLKNLVPTHPEFNVIRTYLEQVVALPWDTTTTDNYDIDSALEQLNKDHFGLDPVKKRIIEHLAVRSLRKDMKGSIMCFSGPPGVGKTSLGQSIAAAMGRKFYRMALGGVRDEAEIRGHRRTYIGALPGKFIHALRQCKSKNPVVLLDEVDKLGKDAYRGDPASALLEVLDPAQNHSFIDNYLAIPFDLSNVLFICTANRVEMIPGPLHDRMEVIEIPGYSTHEKVKIGALYLVPKQIETNGLVGDLVEIPERTLEEIVLKYTREAGVRQLERNIGSVCRGLAVKYSKALKSHTEFLKLTVEPEVLEEALGVPLYDSDLAERVTTPGVVLGLAYTAVGGKVLIVETAKSQGTGNLRITGHLGDVMKESVLTALTWIKSNLFAILPSSVACATNIEGINGVDLHIHFPAAAVPKDGPSAGIAICTAFVSLFANVKSRGDTAMTGEISLRGNVLPIGGVKEKVLGAHRMGIRRVILPVKNQKNLKDVPEYIKKEMEFVFASDIGEVLVSALEDPGVIQNVKKLPKL